MVLLTDLFKQIIKETQLDIEDEKMFKKKRFSSPLFYHRKSRSTNNTDGETIQMETYRFAALEPVRPVRIPFGFQLAITYFFTIHGILGLVQG